MKCQRDLFKKKKINTMNNNGKNTHLSIIESKKLSNQEEQRQNHGYGEHFDGCQIGGGYWGCRGKSEEVRGLRSTNRPWLVWLSGLSASL